MNKEDNEKIEFLKEIDKLKSIERTLRLKHSNNRNETVAEHSWHLGMYIMLFKNHLGKNLDYSKILEFALIHDLVEIYAGDTFIFDKDGLKDKKQREEKAAIKLYNQLPKDTQKRFFKLHEEYEKQESQESKIVYSFDKIQPIIQNLITNGQDWQQNKITYEMIEENKRPKIKHPKVLEIYEAIIQEALDKNLFYS